ncbi:MAG TPA: glycosyltransferase [Sphingomicrobium sp.]|nr:glycosyltransferase [Sphingomicrobium sp.]
MTKVLRIMISVDPLGGGPIEGVAQITNAWRKLGHVHDVVTMDPPDAPFLLEFPGTVIPLGSPGSLVPQGNGRIWERFGYTPGAVRWIKRNIHHYDAAIVSGLWNYAAMAARFGLTGSGVPYFVFTHGMLDPWERESKPAKHQLKRILWVFNEGVLLRNAASVLFTSEEEMLRARGMFWPYKFKGRVVSYGAADAMGPANELSAEFRRSMPALGMRDYFLFLSRIHPKKGCDLLIRSFASFAARMPETDLVIAGPDQPGWSVELESLAKSLGISERIHWPGMVQGRTKWGAYHGATAFILPSHHENFGIVVAEAMAAGKPVLISDKINIWREIATDGAGLVDTDDQAGTDRLFDRYLALNEGERERMGERARDSYLSRFHIDRAALGLLEAVEAGTKNIDSALPLRRAEQH